jgi:hypothetical protein
MEQLAGAAGGQEKKVPELQCEEWYKEADSTHDLWCGLDGEFDDSLVDAEGSPCGKFLFQVSFVKHSFKRETCDVSHCLFSLGQPYYSHVFVCASHCLLSQGNLAFVLIILWFMVLMPDFG